MKRDYLKKHASPEVSDQIDDWDDTLVDAVYRQCQDLSKNADLKGSNSNDDVDDDDVDDVDDVDDDVDDVFPYITEIEFHPNGSKTVHISGARVMIMPDGTT